MKTTIITCLHRNFIALLTFLGFLLLFVPETEAQYFGRNKPGYETFSFNVYQSPHFTIYHYLENDSLLDEFAQQSEAWYKNHVEVFRDTFYHHNPLILYENHGDFQQTTAVDARIGVGTGGVTEVLKNRVVMPIAASNAQTNHVLGHELVHAFQFKILTSGDSLGMRSIRNLPLWFVEGMAEYMSRGSQDPQTAMWMRDALNNDKFPTLEDMTKNPAEYFPYRYGHAFWSFVTKVWGDTTIAPLYKATAEKGYEQALKDVLGHDAETISNMWKNATETAYNNYLEKKKNPVFGKKIISEENAGEVNITPAISPDGKYVVFISEKDIFTLDFFLADSKGNIIKKLSSTVQSNEIDDFNFLESAGAWSPDSRQFAFVVYADGLNKLAILDVKQGKIRRKIRLPEIESFNNPAWSPDGKEIVVSGQKNGNIDLYSYHLETGELKQITSDGYAELQPDWSPNGRYIAYSTDKLPAKTMYQPHKYRHNIAIYDTQTNTSELIPVFVNAQNLNPVFSPDNQSIYFLSDRDGFRNLYRYDIDSDEVFQLTDYLTGIFGITNYAPAISIADNSADIAYSYYTNGTYQIFTAKETDFETKKVNANNINQEAADLPPVKRFTPYSIVDRNIGKDKINYMPEDSFETQPYKPKFQLDYISNAQVGVATSQFGTGVAGGVNMIFSDIVGYNKLFASLALNGEIYDFGGQVSYINQKHQFDWGASVSHIPYRSGSLAIKKDTISYEDNEVIVDNLMVNMLRTFDERVSLFGYYPLSTTRRIEAAGTFSYIHYRYERINNYYSYGTQIGRSKDELEAPNGFFIGKTNVAFVEDNSFFGMASPFQGHRYRIQADRYFGEVNVYNVLADFRKYYFLKPVSFAARAMHIGRYGSEAENNRLSPLFLGYPSLIHGYRNETMYNPQNANGEGFSINQLTGSRIFVGNFEVRLPFTGVEKLALIKSKYFFTELAWFVDGGIAWKQQYSQPMYQSESSGTMVEDTEPIPVFSTGVSCRINLFGYLILEPFYVVPFYEGDFHKGSFGLNFIPGW